MNDPVIFAIQGRAWLQEKSAAGLEAGGGAVSILVFAAAPDEDGAVTRALMSLAEQGYERCEFDRIGVVDAAPRDSDILESAYNDAADGDVAIITVPDAG